MLNKHAVELITFWEECRLVAYADGGSVWTIGWGHTKGVKKGMTCTQEQADKWLEEDGGQVEAELKKWLPHGLGEKQIGALVSFAYNEGEFALRDSTLMVLLKQGDIVRAVRQFLVWTKDDGIEIRGLMRRRLAEAQVFVDGSKW